MSLRLLVSIAKSYEQLLISNSVFVRVKVKVVALDKVAVELSGRCISTLIL